MNRMQVSLIIPAYNEEHRLEMTLYRYGQVLSKQFDDFEIIVVANGCHDRTVQVALEAALTLPQIRILNIEQPVGKGGAILAGFRQANGQFILFADADGATMPDSLLQLLAQLHHYDVAIGSRRLHDSSILRPQPVMRQVLGNIFSLSVHLLFDLPYKDTQCGAKAFRQNVAKYLAQTVEETRWAFDVDLLLQIKLSGYSVIECPVTWEDKAGSHLRIFSTGKEVMHSFRRMKRRKPGLPVWSENVLQ